MTKQSSSINTGPLSALIHPHYTMHTITTAQQACIISLLNAGTSAYKIYNITGVSPSTISCLHSQYCPDLPKSSGGHPTKLTPVDISYAKHIIRMRKADNAVQVTKALQNVTNQTFSSQT